MPYKDPEKKREYLREYNKKRGPAKGYPSQDPESRKGKRNSPPRYRRGLPPEEYAKQYQGVYDRAREKQAARIKEERATVLDHYGWSCSCCGEDEPLFLEVDHVNNDGHSRRESMKKIIALGFPDDLQTLCSNCNQGKRRNGGVCPHKTT